MTKSLKPTPATPEHTRLSRGRSVGYNAHYHYQQMVCVSHQQWAAMYQQMCNQAANAVAHQPGQAPAQQRLQRTVSYPYSMYGGWSPAASVPQVQPTQRLHRAASAPNPVIPQAVPQQPAAPQVAPVPVQQPAEPAAPPQPPVLENAAPAQPQGGFGNLFQPAVAFRLFMFYYLFCSPTLPEWQRTMFVGALVLFYFYSVDLIGYLCPGWRQRRDAAVNPDLDVIPLGPNDDEANNEQRAPPRPLSKRVLVERFVVGLFASLLPSWNPATMN